MDLKLVTYDNESYPNIFTICVGDHTTMETKTYEISSRKNEFNLILKALITLKQQNFHMVGFNNLGYDYPCIHDLLVNATAQTGSMNGEELAYSIFLKSDSIISSKWGTRHDIWESEVKIPQIDLLKINHFDNKNRRTSLKCLMFKMRLMKLGDLPYPPGTHLTSDEMDHLIAYGEGDVIDTMMFLKHCIPALEFRETMNQKLGFNTLNFNDTKIGEAYLIHKLEAHLGPNICYERKGRKKIKKQTKREHIVLAEVIDPRVNITTPELSAVCEWIRSQVITETKGVFTDIDLLAPESAALLPFIDKVSEMIIRDGKGKTGVKKVSSRSSITYVETGEVLYNYLNTGSQKKIDKIRSEYTPDQLHTELTKYVTPKLAAPYKGILIVYGLGGLHASVSNKYLKSDEEWLIVDADVKGYYPRTMISTGAAPAHIGLEFCKVLGEMTDSRDSYEKGSVENKALKLACNGGAYGNTNNQYSPIYDPQCTMQTTINGQLFLTMLIENLHIELGDDVSLIQANTDGITVRIKRTRGNDYIRICKSWCELTSLQLEYAAYDHMWIKDVNNYIAVKQNGDIKAVGDYKDPTHDWAKNHNHLVIYKTAVKCILDPSLDVETEIRNHHDIFDFFFYFKAGGRSFRRLELHRDPKDYSDGRVIQKRSRFLVTTEGERLIKVMDPSTSNPDTERHIGEKAKWLVTLCNDLEEDTVVYLFDIINYDYYIEEVNKLMNFEEVL